MAPTSPFTTALEASSYLHPSGGDLYAPLRASVIATALAMGYDAATMTEVGVNWADDQDQFRHVKNHAYPHYFSQCNSRVFESFEEFLGKDGFEDLIQARGIGVVVKSSTLNLMRAVKFPDALIVANHIKEVLPDRYFGITTIWSLQQQAIVAQSQGYIVFFDHSKGKKANLLEAGGVYADLYHGLTRRKEREAEIERRWEREHSKKPKGKASL